MNYSSVCRFRGWNAHTNNTTGNEPSDYYNCKGWYPIITQAVIDHHGLFTDLCIGWPGSVHDTRVLSNSTLHTRIINGELLQGDVICVRGGNIPVYLNRRFSIPFIIMAYKAISTLFTLVTAAKYLVTSSMISGWKTWIWCNLKMPQCRLLQQMVVQWVIY